MTDSIGNPLPKGMFIKSIDQLDDVLNLNTFLLSCELAIKKGEIVIYDAKNRTATITDKNGMVYFATH